MLRFSLSIAVALVAAAPGVRAASACSIAFVDVFTRFDQSASVVVAKVALVPKISGDVRLRRLRVLKGSSPMNVLGYQHGMCGPSFQLGTRMMVFLDGDGKQLWADATTTNLVAALVAWRRATTDELRRKLLTKWKNGKPGTLQTSAAARLALMETEPGTGATTTTGDTAGAPTQPSRPRWSVADVSWKSPGSAKAAEKRLAALWPALIEAAGEKLGRFGKMTSPVECSQWASVMTAKEAARQVRDTMGEKLDPSVLGSLAALDALGNAAVWNASCSHHFDTLFAYLRASDGSLVMLWLPPEG